MKFIPELTGLRGLAALMVFVAHASKDGLLPDFLGISYGMQGVFLFFTLSGFLMGQLYLERKLTRESLKIYLSARIARIFPLYLFILIVAYLISNFIYSDFHYNFTDPVKFALALFFINTPYELWTVPIEVQFYGCFILFWFFYSQQRRNKVILFLIPFLILIPSIILYKIIHRIPHIMPTFSLFFFAGVFISVLKNKGKLTFIQNKVPAFFSWIIFFLFVINLAGIRKIMGVTDTHASHNIYSLIILIVFFIMIASKPIDFILLSSKPMIFMGEISYGFYMIHRPIIKMISDHNLSPTLVIALSFIATIVLAYFLFRIIEVPSRRFIIQKVS